MKKNAYRDLMEQIQPPAGLNDRVLFAARRRAAEAEQTPAPKRLLPKRRTAFRAAVCAACALALVAGTFTLGPAPGGETEAGGAPVTALPAFSFGLTAYAADTGETLRGQRQRGAGLQRGWRDPLVRRERTLYRLPVPGDGGEHPDHLPGHRPGGAVPQQDPDRPPQGGGAEVPGGRGQRHGVPAASAAGMSSARSTATRKRGP